MNKLIKILCCTLAIMLSACAYLPGDDEQEQQWLNEKAVAAKQNIHFYVEQLAKQLLFTSQSINPNQSVAVGTFLPTAGIDGKAMPQNNILGLQIQESFVTLATQAGLKVVEFKATKAIKVTKDRDLMLSRQIADLNPYVRADYYLTGTYTSQESNTAVNARLIDVRTQNVVAAATDFIPNDVMWEQGKVLMKNNKIYRSED